MHVSFNARRIYDCIAWCLFWSSIWLWYNINYVNELLFYKLVTLVGLHIRCCFFHLFTVGLKNVLLFHFCLVFQCIYAVPFYWDRWNAVGTAFPVTFTGFWNCCASQYWDIGTGVCFQCCKRPWRIFVVVVSEGWGGGISFMLLCVCFYTKQLWWYACII